MHRNPVDTEIFFKLEGATGHTGWTESVQSDENSYNLSSYVDHSKAKGDYGHTLQKLPPNLDMAVQKKNHDTSFNRPHEATGKHVQNKDGDVLGVGPLILRLIALSTAAGILPK